jgi:rubrerythrin
MSVDSCDSIIPTDTADGVLNCTATRTDTPVCVGGRRPLAWARTHPDECARLDAIATMEQVSIVAFAELAAQLARNAAPSELVARCRAAAEDERRHVELLVELGAARPRARPRLASSATSLLEIATHNAVEGCVTETWAALLAAHQARTAEAAATREAFAEIARDEARHAQLAWDLHAWLSGRLSTAERARVEAARARALARLESSAVLGSRVAPATLRRRLGLPDPQRAAILARSFGTRLAAA